MEKVKYGIVGIGKQGSYYAKLMRDNRIKNAVLTAVADIAEDRRNWAKESLPNVKVFNNEDELIQSGEVDAIIINTPHYQHPQIAIKALKKDINVLSDKPAGVYCKAVREAAEYAKENKPDLHFGLLLNQRTSKVYKAAKKIIQSGELGNLKRMVWIITDWYRPQAYYDQGGWRGTWEGEGGGVLINQDPHQLDLFTWLAGEKIVSVWADAKTVGRNINVENDVTACCKFESGATGVFITSTHEAPGTNRLEISGDGGKIVVSGNSWFNMKLEFIKNEVFETEFSKTNKGFMSKPKNSKSKVKFNIAEQFKLLVTDRGQQTAVIQNFTDVILGKEKELIGKYEEGLNGLGFSNAIHLSAWTGKEIACPVDEEQYIKELNKRIEEEKNSKE